MFGKKTKISEKILILGLGGVGYYLAKRLVHEGYAVTVIEADSQLVRQADGEMDARLIQGNAMSIACWKEAEADRMDFLIAVTDNDAVNMLAAMIADRFGIQRKIARVRSREFDNSHAVLNTKDLKIDLAIHPGRFPPNGHLSPVCARLVPPRRTTMSGRQKQLTGGVLAPGRLLASPW